MIFYVYILYSESLKRYYIGQTEDIEKRLDKHNTKETDRNDFTQKGIPWHLIISFKCANRKQALKVEQHIKKMKSKTYILNLQKYPEMGTKLLEKYL